MRKIIKRNEVRMINRVALLANEPDESKEEKLFHKIIDMTKKHINLQENIYLGFGDSDCLAIIDSCVHYACMGVKYIPETAIEWGLYADEDSNTVIEAISKVNKSLEPILDTILNATEDEIDELIPRLKYAFDRVRSIAIFNSVLDRRPLLGDQHIENDELIKKIELSEEDKKRLSKSIENDEGDIPYKDEVNFYPCDSKKEEKELHIGCDISLFDFMNIMDCSDEKTFQSFIDRINTNSSYKVLLVGKNKKVSVASLILNKTKGINTDKYVYHAFAYMTEKSSKLNTEKKMKRFRKKVIENINGAISLKVSEEAFKVFDKVIELQPCKRGRVSKAFHNNELYMSVA